MPKMVVVHWFPECRPAYRPPLLTPRATFESLVAMGTTSPGLCALRATTRLRVLGIRDYPAHAIDPS